MVQVFQRPDGSFDGSFQTESENLQSRFQTSFFPREAWARLSLSLAVLIGLICRSIKLTTLFPILVDEAIYMRWAEIIHHQKEWFISLLDGKTPLLFWLYASLRLVIPDPLLADRLVSVCAGCMTIVLLYRIAYLCAGTRAGVVAAALTSVLPFGTLYDRLGYADSVVNLFGVCVVYASIAAFGKSDIAWSRIVVAGLTLGLGLFTKTTVVLYLFCPLAIGVYLKRKQSWKLLLPRILVLYATAALFPLWAHFAVPNGPMPAENNSFLHHTNFFTPPIELLCDPLTNLRSNTRLLAHYAVAYVGGFALFASLIAVSLLLITRRYLPILILACSSTSLLAISLFLVYFRSRYVFPLAWPLILAVACAMSAIRLNATRQIWSIVIVAATFTLMLLQSSRILRTPEVSLARDDADEFLGFGPYSGSGLPEAIAFLRAEARGGPEIILTDPWWGPPTDAVFAYLNQRDGIEVYEAWWLQPGVSYPLLPRGFMQVWRSQYQRIWIGAVDFSRVSRLYYLTDSAYHIEKSVPSLDRSARLVRRFRKRRRNEFIEVYLLNTTPGQLDR
jgi:uncharacterized membrane protein